MLRAGRVATLPKASASSSTAVVPEAFVIGTVPDLLATLPVVVVVCPDDDGPHSRGGGSLPSMRPITLPGYERPPVQIGREGCGFSEIPVAGAQCAIDHSLDGFHAGYESSPGIGGHQDDRNRRGVGVAGPEPSEPIGPCRCSGASKPTSAGRHLEPSDSSMTMRPTPPAAWTFPDLDGDGSEVSHGKSVERRFQVVGSWPAVEDDRDLAFEVDTNQVIVAEMAGRDAESHEDERRGHLSVNRGVIGNELRRQAEASTLSRPR